MKDTIIGQHADTTAYWGQVSRSRELSRQIIEAALSANRNFTAADYEVRAALRDGLYGYKEEARRQARAALGHAALKDARFGAALALAFAGDVATAKAAADALVRDFPEDTIVRFLYGPTINAQLAVNRGRGSEAVDILQVTAPYDLAAPGNVGFCPVLYPVYVRASAYLAARDGKAATTELQKILNHPGLAKNQPIAALARLQLGRAYALSGDAAKARTAYEDFFALWRDADPDVPILMQARAENRALQ